MKLYLLRHGMTEANEKSLYCGSTDIPLSENGLAELKRLRERGGYPPARGCRILTSGMLRTEQTLNALYGSLPHERVSALREIDFGVFEMKSYEELKERDDYQEWISGNNYEKSCPGGESGETADTRAQTVFDEMASSSKDSLIFTHGGIIAGYMARLFPGEKASRYAWQPHPGHGYAVVFENSRPVLYYPIPLV